MKKGLTEGRVDGKDMISSQGDQGWTERRAAFRGVEQYQDGGVRSFGEVTQTGEDAMARKQSASIERHIEVERRVEDDETR